MHLPPIVGVSTGDILKGTQFAVLALNSPVVSALKEMEVAAQSMQSNVQVSLLPVSVVPSISLSRPLMTFAVGIPWFCLPRVIVQFDGSAHRNQRVGGAGAALLQVESNGVSLLDWRTRALPNCADNIVAETYGADLAIALYDRYRCLCQNKIWCRTVPLPLDRIQGDIKPLLHHLDFRGRFRRRDLVSLIHQFHAKRSRIAPSLNIGRVRQMRLLTILLGKQAPT